MEYIAIRNWGRADERTNQDLSIYASGVTVQKSQQARERKAVFYG